MAEASVQRFLAALDGIAELPDVRVLASLLVAPPA